MIFPLSFMVGQICVAYAYHDWEWHLTWKGENDKEEGMRFVTQDDIYDHVSSLLGEGVKFEVLYGPMK